MTRKSKVEIDVIKMFKVTPKLKFFTIVASEPEQKVVGDDTAYLNMKELLELKEDVNDLLTEINVTLLLAKIGKGLEPTK